MPLYEFKCPDCGYEDEFLQRVLTAVECTECNAPMKLMVSLAPMVKIKGEGGYPSRRRHIQNTTYRKHPPLEHDPKPIHFIMG